MRNRSTILVILALACPGIARAMDVATFLDQYDAVKRKGLFAASSPEAKALFEELNVATRELRSERLAAAASGRRPAYCPPEKTRAGPLETIRALQAVPPAERRRTQLRDALRPMYAKKYPCP